MFFSPSPFRIPKKNEISTLFSLLSPSSSSIKEKTAKKDQNSLIFSFFSSFKISGVALTPFCWLCLSVTVTLYSVIL